VVIALSGACGSEAHAGGNLPEFTDGRYRRRNLPFNGTTADDEVAPISVVRAMTVGRLKSTEAVEKRVTRCGRRPAFPSQDGRAAG